MGISAEHSWIAGALSGQSPEGIYPVHYISARVLEDGTKILLRPISPLDEPLEYEMLRTLSMETVRARFFVSSIKFTPEMVKRFCNIDYVNETAIVAETGADDRRRIAGIGRLIAESPEIAEFAIVIHDDFQNRGIGRMMTDVIVGIARDRGLKRIYADILCENERMIKMARTKGFTVRYAGDWMCRAELDLT